MATETQELPVLGGFAPSQAERKTCNVEVYNYTTMPLELDENVEFDCTDVVDTPPIGIPAQSVLRYGCSSAITGQCHMKTTWLWRGGIRIRIYPTVCGGPIHLMPNDIHVGIFMKGLLMAGKAVTNSGSAVIKGAGLTVRYACGLGQNPVMRVEIREL